FFGAQWTIPHPEVVEYASVKQEVGLQTVYSTTEKLTDKGFHSKGLEKLIIGLLEQMPSLTETLPAYMLQEIQLMNRTTAYKQVHQPKDLNLANMARGRLKFEELFYLQMELLVRKQINVQKTSGFVFSEVGNLFTDFYNNGLPFELTNAQKRVVREIRKDFLTGQQMNRLLQGDVGAGKTLVALLTALIGIGNGYQAA